MKLKEFLNLQESKDHLINKLDLTDSEKQVLIDFFRKHPNYESKVDWNNKNLTWKDFKDLLSIEGKSKTQAKKRGIEGLTEGVDYTIISSSETETVYRVLTHLGSRVLASNKVGSSNTAKWCISMNKSTYWSSYTRNGYVFIFVIKEGEPKYPYDKFAISFGVKGYQDFVKRKIRQEGSYTPKKRDLLQYMAAFDCSDSYQIIEAFKADNPKVFNNIFNYLYNEDNFKIEVKSIEELNDLEARENIASLTVGPSRDFGYNLSFRNPTKSKTYVGVLKILAKHPEGLKKRELLKELQDNKWLKSYANWEYVNGRYITTDTGSDYWTTAPNSIISGHFSALFVAMRRARLVDYSAHDRKWRLGPTAQPYMEYWSKIFSK